MPPSEPPDGAKTPHRRTATGIAFLAMGLLILVPSGLCTAYAGFIAFTMGRLDAAFGILAAAALFGGPFILLGLGFIRTGLRERPRE